MENVTSCINPSNKILDYISITHKFTQGVINEKNGVNYNNINQYVIGYAAADQKRRRVQKKFRIAIRKIMLNYHLPTTERLLKQLEIINLKCRKIRGFINSNQLTYNDVPQSLHSIVKKIDLSEFEIVIPNHNIRINNYQSDGDDDVDWQDAINRENTSGNKGKTAKRKKGKTYLLIPD